MRPQVRAFRNAATNACQLQRFPFPKFMDERGLEEILEQADEEDWPAKEIAGQVLFRCCVTDGKFNNFQVGFLSVIVFLKTQFGSLGRGEEQAFKDLASVLKNSGNLQSIMSWLDSHYT